MAHWNEIDNISEKLLKKILLGENKADSIPSQECTFLKMVDSD